MSDPCGRFDPETHTYYLLEGKRERRIPSVTQILNGVLGRSWHASDWHMGRGRVVHACSALLAKGIPFECDERIKGQVDACRSFLVTCMPDVIEVEQDHYSRLYQYGGTPDLVCKIDGKRRIVDYKGTLTPETELQLGGYGELIGCDWGMGVELRADGTYNTTGMLDLRRARREFLSLRTTYAVLDRLGRLTKEEAA